MHILCYDYGRRVLFWKNSRHKLSVSQAAVNLSIPRPSLHSLFSFSVPCSDQLSCVWWPSLYILTTNAEQLYALLLDSCLVGQEYFNKTKQSTVFQFQIIISDDAFIWIICACMDNEWNCIIGSFWNWELIHHGGICRKLNWQITKLVVGLIQFPFIELFHMATRILN